MQIITHLFEGEVKRGDIGEYGDTEVHFQGKSLIESVPSKFRVWMSHFDEVIKTPKNYDVLLKSQNNIISGIQHKEKPILGIQFHPETKNSEYGDEILEYFLKTVGKLEKNWSIGNMLDEVEESLTYVKDENVLCAFSGGVDSLVAATVVEKKIKDKLYCFFIDHGLLRLQDLDHIKKLQKETSLNIEIIDAKETFLNSLKEIQNPEEKRKIIGKTFIEIFEKKVHEYEKEHNIKFKYLLQGTLYTDVIESIAPYKKDGKSITIKSHHNVGGLPEKMKLKLLEPFRYLFKDEVRKIGKN